MALLTPAAGAQERRLPGESRERVRTEPIDVVHGDDFTPLRGTTSGLIDPNDPRYGVMPGVAWTPGLPGGGGGSGGPWEPAVADSYTVGTVLPCLPAGEDCNVYGASRSGSYLIGASLDGTQTERPCLNANGEPIVSHDRHAVVWELDATGALIALHDLPNPMLDGGWDYAVALAVNEAGLSVGQSFLRWAPCSVGGWQSRAVTWSLDPDGSWTQEDLPTGTDGQEIGKAASVNVAGWIVGHLWADADDDGEAERAGPVAWMPDSREPSGWRLEWLPVPSGVDSTHAHLINDAGTIAGYAFTTDADGNNGRHPLTWRRSRLGGWLLAELPTLGGDRATPAFLTEDGQLVGWSSTGVIEPGQGNDPDTEQEHAARWIRDPMSGTWLAPEDLGTLAGPRSWAFGQLSQRLVIGRSTFDLRNRNDYRAVAWDEGIPIRLDAITAGRWTFKDAWEVLPSGRIVVEGYEGSQGPSQLMILDPAEAP